MSRATFATEPQRTLLALQSRALRRFVDALIAPTR